MEVNGALYSVVWVSCNKFNCNEYNYINDNNNLN